MDSLQSLFSQVLIDVSPLISFWIDGLMQKYKWNSQLHSSLPVSFQTFERVELSKSNSGPHSFFPRPSCLVNVTDSPVSSFHLYCLVSWMNPLSDKLMKDESDNMHWKKIQFSIWTLFFVSKSSVQSYRLYKSRERVKLRKCNANLSSCVGNRLELSQNNYT